MRNRLGRRIGGECELLYPPRVEVFKDRVDSPVHLIYSHLNLMHFELLSDREGSFFFVRSNSSFFGEKEQIE